MLYRAVARLSTKPSCGPGDTNPGALARLTPVLLGPHHRFL
jgi:hypothetical protein